MMADRPDSAAIAELLREFAATTGADGVTLWIAEGNDLVAQDNPLEPEIIGLRQALSSGLISQVMLTGQAILETDLSQHPAHDPSMDLKLGKPCQSMMAAFWQRGDDSGVISAVVHLGSKGSFTLDSLRKLGTLAGKISQSDDQETC